MSGNHATSANLGGDTGRIIEADGTFRKLSMPNGDKLPHMCHTSENVLDIHVNNQGFNDSKMSKKNAAETGGLFQR